MDGLRIPQQLLSLCSRSPIPPTRASYAFIVRTQSQLALSRRQRRAYSSAPKIDRSKKLFDSADTAVADLQSGSTILSAGFGLCGVAETIIKAIRDRGSQSLHSLTAVSNNAGIEGIGGLSLITKTGQVNKLIISFLGNNKALEKKYLSGDITVELCPQGQ